MRRRPRPPLRRVGDACLAQPAWLPRESQAAARTPESTELGLLLPPQCDGLCVSVESAFVVHVCGAGGLRVKEARKGGWCGSERMAVSGR